MSETLLDRGRDELEAMVASLPVVDPVAPDPEDPGAAASPPVLPPIPEDLSEVAVGDLAQIVAQRLSDADLQALPEVQAAIADPDLEVRDVRGDYEAAALGALTEAQREDLARQAAEAEVQARVDAGLPENDMQLDGVVPTPDPEPAQNA